jgi:hypothetical protein
MKNPVLNRDMKTISKKLGIPDASQRLMGVIKDIMDKK